MSGCVHVSTLSVPELHSHHSIKVSFDGTHRVWSTYQYLTMVHIWSGLHTSLIPWCLGCGLHTNLLPWYFRSGLCTWVAYDGTLWVWSIYQSLLHTGSGQQSHSFTTIPIRFSLYTNPRQCYTMVWSMWSCWQPMIQVVYTSGSPTTLHFGMIHSVMLLTAYNAG